MVESLRKERANPKFEALGPKKHSLNSIPPPNLEDPEHFYFLYCFLWFTPWVTATFATSAYPVA